MVHRRIRPYESKDAPFLCAVFFNAVRVVGLRAYSEEQVEAWAPMALDPVAFEARARDGRLVLVVVDDSDVPVAYGELERNGHIDHLYCRSEVSGTGVGSALYDQLEENARERRMAKLFVEASEVARRLFLAKGFTEIRRQEFRLRGVLLHNYMMEKWLLVPPK